jgi:hypothetical protein
MDVESVVELNLSLLSYTWNNRTEPLPTPISVPALYRSIYSSG